MINTPFETEKKWLTSSDLQPDTLVSDIVSFVSPGSMYGIVPSKMVIFPSKMVILWDL